MYFGCWGNCGNWAKKRDGIVHFKFGQNWAKLGKIWAKLGKIGQDWAKLGKIGQNQENLIMDQLLNKGKVNLKQEKPI